MIELPTLPDERRATLPPMVVTSIAALEAAVQQMVGRVAEWEAQQRQNSTNSSRPPSTDRPGTARPPTPPPGQRRPGGQPGHRGHFRALRPLEQVDRVGLVLPAQCGRCGETLAAAAGPTDPADVRHQVPELPPVRVQVTAYRMAARHCPACGHVTRAVVPATAAAGMSGPRLSATCALLSGRYRLSQRETASALADRCGVDRAVGTVSAVEQQVSTARAPAVAAARTAVQRAAVVHMDETGWRAGRQRAWLWTAVTALVTVFHIDRSRGSGVVRALLGPNWCGIVGSDRFSAYRWLGAHGRQVCWAHLKRDFPKLVDWGPGPRPVGERLLAGHAQVVALWHRHRAGELDRAELAVANSRVAAEFRAVLETGTTGHAVAQPLCRELLRVWPARWTVVLVAGVEPTNNTAEQALRPAV